MMGFTDEMVGLDIAHKRELKTITRDAQALVNQLDSDIESLRRQLAQAQADVARERGMRIALKAQLDAILDMEI
jgi:hypothetical protein